LTWRQLTVVFFSTFFIFHTKINIIMV
jgi:hypothetical protein